MIEHLHLFTEVKDKLPEKENMTIVFHRGDSFSFAYSRIDPDTGIGYFVDLLGVRHNFVTHWLDPSLLTTIVKARNGVEKENDKWIQGYVCAVCVMITLDQIVQTTTREMYRSGCGKTTIEELKRKGVDTHDLEILTKHWKELNS